MNIIVEIRICKQFVTLKWLIWTNLLEIRALIWICWSSRLISSRWTLAAVMTFPFLRCTSIERVFSVLCMDPMECLWISKASLHSKRGKNVWYHGTFKFDRMSFQRAGAVQLSQWLSRGINWSILFFITLVEDGEWRKGWLNQQFFPALSTENRSTGVYSRSCKTFLNWISLFSGQHNHVVRLRATAKSCVCFKYYCFCYK